MILYAAQLEAWPIGGTVCETVDEPDTYLPTVCIAAAAPATNRM